MEIGCNREQVLYIGRDQPTSVNEIGQWQNECLPLSDAVMMTMLGRHKERAREIRISHRTHLSRYYLVKQIFHPSISSSGRMEALELPSILVYFHSESTTEMLYDRNVTLEK